MKKHLFVVSMSSFLLTLVNPTSLPAMAAESEQMCPAHSSHNISHRSKTTLLIKAPPAVVWDVIMNQDDSDDTEYSKTLEHHGNMSIIEEKYTKLPIIGEAVVVLRQYEEPYKKIEYELIKSDKFKAMEGSWTLTPEAEGKHTFVELTSYTDTGLPIPRFIIEMTTKQRIKSRLEEIATIIEKNQKHSQKTASNSK